MRIVDRLIDGIARRVARRLSPVIESAATRMMAASERAIDACYATINLDAIREAAVGDYIRREYESRTERTIGSLVIVNEDDGA